MHRTDRASPNMGESMSKNQPASRKGKADDIRPQVWEQVEAWKRYFWPHLPGKRPNGPEWVEISNALIRHLDREGRESDAALLERVKAIVLTHAESGAESFNPTRKEWQTVREADGALNRLKERSESSVPIKG